ncbi:Transferase [Corchorus olitorius]|uniref:Transferase n=1 Tax=Corchorus olitorius TaxID=93759 RepID=A0A1R3JCM2_9ROSI|nr:Transferase [Corchorus olitorius]
MEVANESATKKPKRLTSVVWNHFERVRKADICYAVCVHCNKKLSGSSNSGTTHLRNHLMRCLKRSNYDVSQLLAAKRRKKDAPLTIANISYDEGQRKEEFIKPTIVKYEQEQRKDEVFNLGSSRFDQERSQLDLARMIILHGYPLGMVEHVGFKVFVKNLQPLFDVVPNNTVELSCMEIYGKEKQKVYDMLSKLQGRINLAVEMWCSPENMSYLCLTAHYIDDDWRLQKKILNFVTLDSSHTEDLLSEVIMKCLMDWDIELSAILDPRFKMKLVEYYYSQIYGSTALERIKEVSDGIKELFNAYSICSTLIDQGSALPGSSLPSSSNDSRDRLKGFDKFLHETSQSQSAVSDLEKYLEEPVFPRNCDFNILNWWRVHTPRYPILSMMARDVLGTPMSTVAKESSFNAGGRVLDSCRSSLTPDTRQALICTRDWLRTQSDEESKQPFYLTTWELLMLSLHYTQNGLLFAKPPLAVAHNKDKDLMKNLIEKLKKSLSLALVHFYPLAGRFVTTRQENQNPPVYYVYVDCNNSPGAKLIHAAIDMTISDVVSPKYVPEAVESFFDHDRAVNHDGHSRPLLSIQVTELVDGVFIGFSISHSIVDGTSFWHFVNALSEIFQGQNLEISRPPVLERWFPEGHGPILNLPFTHEDEFITRFEAPGRLLRRHFHISAESVAKLKTRANSEYKLLGTAKISSFQSLSAFVWKSITKARRFPKHLVTSCKLAINNRSRLEPPLSPSYFGNSVQTVKAVTTVGELLEHNLGWAAWQLHQAVANHTNESVRELVDNWLRKHFIYQPDQFLIRKVLSWQAHQDSTSRKGGGSIDLEVNLPPHSMHALESDEEFMAIVSNIYTYPSSSL